MSEQLQPPLEQFAEQLADLIARRLHALHVERGSLDVPTDHRSPWLSADKAALYLDWSKQRLYKLTASGAIPHYKHEGRLLFHRGELDRWMAEHAQPARREPD